MAFDCFLKLQTIPGESTDDKHANWIECLSYSHGVTQSLSGGRSTAGGAAAERCDHSDFSVVKELDKATPKLNLACCNGEHIGEVIIELCEAGGSKETYMKYTLSDVIVSSVRPGGSAQGGDGRPLEEITFNYGKIDWTYNETDHATGKKKGSVSASWDVKKNTGS